MKLFFSLNSTMVRLQRVFDPKLGGYVIASQFHYGSITTLQMIIITIKDISNVSIPLWFDYNNILEVIPTVDSRGLNSTMVRLQLIKLVDIVICCHNWSQFHYGSITTKTENEYITVRHDGLNSTMVRLQLT